ncbi:hypothetical protein IM538_05640 [Cytobacillus suaedae]|nr:hypothetical protein IM538_05640 [Cytobacillus suaedae]
MDNENRCEGFNCPEFVPADAPDDFCIPEECCPPRIQQPKFPSPNSCLPEERLEELEAKIRQANQVLLDLGLSEERTPDEIYQRAFDGLIGQKVLVEINCPVSEEVQRNIIKCGIVTLVGFDFVVLRNKNEKEIIIPFGVINKIKLKGRFAEPNEENSLNEIDPCFRRRLTFRFGETVSSSPELIQLFFRLRLKIYLMLLVNKRLMVRIEGKKIRGTLFDVHRETLTLKKKIKVKKKKKNKKMEIPQNNICYLSVK